MSDGLDRGDRHERAQTRPPGFILAIPLLVGGYVAIDKLGAQTVAASTVGVLVVAVSLEYIARTQRGGSDD